MKDKATKRKGFIRNARWTSESLADLGPSTDDECLSPSLAVKPETDCLTIKKINGGYNFDNFDESQHLNGCPLKWFYNKKQSERDKRYRIEKRCSYRSVKPESARRERKKNVRDRTPVDVKIHKINLLEKNGGNSSKSPNRGANASMDDVQRKNLAAKLNWKFHDLATDEDSLAEPFSEISSRQDYLPPRPLIGLKPLLTILLFPNQETNCCSTRLQLKSNILKGNSPRSPMLAIKSLDLPMLAPQQVRSAHPKTVHAQRWGSKSCKLQKKLQIPNQVTINLRTRPCAGSSSEKMSSFPPASAPPPTPARTLKSERSNNRSRDRSLSTLIYELGDKTCFRNDSHDGFEDLLREITIDDEDSMQGKRIFRLSDSANGNQSFPSALGHKLKQPDECKYVETPTEVDDDLNLTCEKVRIFEKLPRKRK